MDQQLPRLDREAGRLILFDQFDRILLIRGHDTGSTDRPWWITPGGGCEPGEDHRSAAIRETAEETGLVPTWVGKSCLERTAEFAFIDVYLVQHEHLFPARVHLCDVGPTDSGQAGAAPDRSRWTELERRILMDLRWFALEELAGVPETVYPEHLLELAGRLLRDVLPPAVETGG